MFLNKNSHKSIIILVSFFCCLQIKNLYGLDFKRENFLTQNAQKNNLDLESLGLDNVDQNVISNNNNSKNSANQNFKESQPKIVEEVNSADEIKEKKLVQKKQKIKKINKAKKNKLAKRLQNEQKIIAEQKIIKEPETIVDPEIDQYWQAKIANEEENIDQQKSTENQPQQYNKSDVAKRKKVLNDLRRLYLGEEKDPSIQRLQEIDSDFVQDELIIPRSKNLNKFSVDELPAYPILSSHRADDNKHIPYILSPKEKIKMLFDTIIAGDVLSFVEIYKTIKNPNVQNELGDTLLTQAILLKKHPIVAEILIKGADPDLPNRLGFSPIEIAIELLDFKALQLLVENKANINSLDRFGRSYLMHASRVGFLPAVDLLVKNGAEINIVDYDGFSPLSIAYRHKKEIVVQYLLKKGAKQWMPRKNLPEKQTLINELETRWNN